MIHANSQCPSDVKTDIFIITGYSGAGKSTVLRALEDNGFLCIDNLPTQLLSAFFSLIAEKKISNSQVALGLDVRSSFTVTDLHDSLINLGPLKNNVKLFFLSSSSHIIVKRFQETRRKHPLAHDIDIAAAIEYEKQLMRPFIEIADEVINTDQLTIHQLRTVMRSYNQVHEEKKILVSLISFGFKFGIPPESNFIFDLTSLPNPYFVPELKNLTGLHTPVQEYLFSQQAVQEYWQKSIDFITHVVKKSYEEGRLSITLAIGCTGGRHRSVTFVDALAKMQLEHVQFLIKHRDIDNESQRYSANLVQEK